MLRIIVSLVVLATSLIVFGIRGGGPINLAGYESRMVGENTFMRYLNADGSSAPSPKWTSNAPPRKPSFAETVVADALRADSSLPSGTETSVIVTKHHRNLDPTQELVAHLDAASNASKRYENRVASGQNTYRFSTREMRERIERWTAYFSFSRNSDAQSGCKITNGVKRCVVQPRD